MTTRGIASHKTPTVERVCIECKKLFLATSSKRLICDDRCAERRKWRARKAKMSV